MSDSMGYFLITLFQISPFLHTAAPTSNCNAILALGFISVMLSALCCHWYFLFKPFDEETLGVLVLSPLVTVARLEGGQNDL